MIVAPQYDNEIIRLQEVRSLGILDTPPDIRFDCIVDFAVELFHAPIGFIALIDKDRQWFKSVVGLELQETPRDISICAHAICEVKSKKSEKRIFYISNTGRDPRFFDNPLVADDPRIKSYLSYVLSSESGENIGTVCVIDTIPRKYADNKIQVLIRLGKMVENLLYGRHHLYGLGGYLH